jgi:hypothetical protein
MVVGYQTMVDAKVIGDATRSKGLRGRLQLPVSEAVSEAVSASGVVMMVGNLAVQVQSSDLTMVSWWGSQTSHAGMPPILLFLCKIGAVSMIGTAVSISKHLTIRKASQQRHQGDWVAC